MDLTLPALLTITVLALAASATGNPPDSGPKYVPVFISSDALSRLNEKDGQVPAQPVESGHEKLNSDNDIKKEIQNIFYGPPAPVYEHQQDQHDPSYSPPPLALAQNNHNFQNQQPQIQQQYQNIQPPIQQSISNQQQPYPVNQQPIQMQPPNQIQQYQISQPAQPQAMYPINQQPQQIQPIVVAQRTGQQPIYGNQQQMLQQPQQDFINQQPLYNQQQLVAQPQPIQTYQQPSQLLISQPSGNQQMLTQSSTPMLIHQQSPLPNQQAILLQQQNQNAQIPNQQAILLQQPNQNRQITSNISPINLIQPNPINPGYIQNQNQNLYAVVPLNGQNLGSNQNVGSNTYLVPVQQVPNQVFAVNSGY